jgi:hypothetical protein
MPQAVKRQVHLIGQWLDGLWPFPRMWVCTVMTGGFYAVVALAGYDPATLQRAHEKASVYPYLGTHDRQGWVEVILCRCRDLCCPVAQHLCPRSDLAIICGAEMSTSLSVTAVRQLKTTTNRFL